MRDPFIIITVGHSGSSAFTNILNELGLFIGTNLIKGKNKNYYEHKYFQEVNQTILGSDGYPYEFSDTEGLLKRLEVYDGNKEFINKIRKESFNIMENEGCDNRPWGFKNPKSCLTFPIWHQIFPNAKYFFLTRNYEDTKKGWHPKGDDGYFLFEKVFKKAIEFCEKEKITHYIIDYNELTYCFEETIKKLSCIIHIKDMNTIKNIWKPKYESIDVTCPSR